MSEYHQRLSVAGPLLLAALLIGFPVTLSAQEQPMRWNGTDLVVELPMGATVSQDLAASDSATYVYRIEGVTLDSVSGNATVGPQGRRASLEILENELKLVVVGDERFGSTSLLRPYSGRLYIHTFDWSELEYGAEQYHKGLIALDEGLQDQAIEYLNSAHNFGERRAASVLGAIYLDRGDDSLAAEYLRAPIDADDFMARAAARLSMGDTAGYRQDSINYATEGEVSLGFEVPRDPEREAGEEVVVSSGDFFDDWRGYALIVLAALLIIMLAVWFSRRPSPEKPEPVEGHDHRPTPTPPPPPVPDHTRVETASPRTDQEPSPAGQDHRLDTSGRTMTPSRGEESEISESRQESRQAAELRNRMNRNLSEEGESESVEASVEADETREESADVESSTARAKKMNVSRDYVDLKEKISRMKERLDSDSPRKSED